MKKTGNDFPEGTTKSNRKMTARAKPKKLPAPPLTNASGEVRQMTRSDIEKFRPAAEVLPAALLRVLPAPRNRRGPQRHPTKELMSIRLDKDVLAHYRELGAGWQSKINAILRKEMKKDNP